MREYNRLEFVNVGVHAGTDESQPVVGGVVGEVLVGNLWDEAVHRPHLHKQNRAKLAAIVKVLLKE